MGSIGFIVDAMTLVAFMKYVMYSLEIGRVVSFLIAVFVTWILNRTFTFSQKSPYSKKKEYSIYITIQSTGAVLNYSVFVSLIYYFSVMKENYLFALAIASLIAMIFNYSLLKSKLFTS